MHNYIIIKFNYIKKYIIKYKERKINFKDNIIIASIVKLV